MIALSWFDTSARRATDSLLPGNFLLTGTHGADEDKDFAPSLVQGNRECKLVSPAKISGSLN